MDDGNLMVIEETSIVYIFMYVYRKINTRNGEHLRQKEIMTELYENTRPSSNWLGCFGKNCFVVVHRR